MIAMKTSCTWVFAVKGYEPQKSAVLKQDGGDLPLKPGSSLVRASVLQEKNNSRERTLEFNLFSHKL
jgi:hypothetical protein